MYQLRGGGDPSLGGIAALEGEQTTVGLTRCDRRMVREASSTIVDDDSFYLDLTATILGSKLGSTPVMLRMISGEAT